MANRLDESATARILEDYGAQATYPTLHVDLAAAVRRGKRNQHRRVAALSALSMVGVGALAMAVWPAGDVQTPSAPQGASPTPAEDRSDGIALEQLDEAAADSEKLYQAAALLAPLRAAHPGAAGPLYWSAERGVLQIGIAEGEAGEGFRAAVMATDLPVPVEFTEWSPLAAADVVDARRALESQLDQRRSDLTFSDVVLSGDQTTVIVIVEEGQVEEWMDLLGELDLDVPIEAEAETFLVQLPGSGAPRD